MKSAHRFAACWLLAGCTAGCATPPVGLSSAAHELAGVNVISLERAKQAAAAGASKADVVAALGEATVVRFGSGYEVWVYRTVDQPRKQGTDSRAPAAAPNIPSSETRSEFVILFEPFGTVAKARIRMAPNAAP